MRAGWIVFFWVVALAIFVLLGALNLCWGELNQDEGWYLYAARRVSQGYLPYKDFAFTQGPVFPLVYARLHPLVDRCGVAGGRKITAVLGFLASLSAAWLAGRAARRGAGRVVGVLAFILISCNVYQSYFTTVVKTYSLTALLLVLGFVALSYARSRGGGSAAFLSGFLIALAAGVRISAGAALPVVGVYLLINRKALGDLRWIAFGVGGVVGLAGWALPFAILAPDGFRFAMLEYHTARSVGSLANLLIYKAGFISRFAQAFFVPMSLTLGVVLFRWMQPVAPATSGQEDVPPQFSAVMWIAVAAVSLTHFLAPFPYEDYQVFVMPVLAAALAVSLSEVVLSVTGPVEERSSRWLLWLTALVLLVSTAAAFSSPINQNWFVRGRDRIWWPFRTQSPVQQLSDVSAWIGKLSWLDRTLLTQDAYIAVQAGMDVPEGMEMGPFCYYPDMDTEKAKRLRVLNREMMIELLRSVDAPVAAFSGYGLAIRGPEVMPLPVDEQKMLWSIIEERYEPICDVEHFGQGDTTLRILVRRRETGDLGR